MEENEIIKGCKEGKEVAFKELVFQYSGILFGVCMRYLRNKNDAEDALQDSFIKIYTFIHTFRKISSFKSWMIKITVNVCLKQLRKYKQTYDIGDAIVTESHEISVIDEMNAQEILLLLDRLPEMHRLVFNLHAIEGYDHAEIGEILSIAESSSRVYLFRARQQLQELTNTYSLKIINK